MPYETTQETGAQAEVISQYHAVFRSDTERSGEQHAGRLISSTKTGESDADQDWHLETVPNGPHRSSDSVKATRLLFDRCMQALDRAIQGDGDLIEQGNAFFNFSDILQELWERRNEQESQFAQLVNILQTLLLESVPEDFSKAQIQSIRQVIEKASDRRPISDEDLATYIKILDKGGCDVFRALR